MGHWEMNKFEDGKFPRVTEMAEPTNRWNVLWLLRETMEFRCFRNRILQTDAAH